MTYEEFVKGMQEMGFDVYHQKPFIGVREGYSTVVAVSKTKVCEMNVSNFDLSAEVSFSALDLACKLARTPLAERYKEKKYYLKVSNTLFTNKYLNIEKETGKISLLDNLETDNYKTEFTESELASMDTTGFILEEVTD